jgi:hypothetical protein
MTAATFALQKAIYDALQADPGVRAELGNPPRVFDEAPEGTAHPYVVIGEGRVQKTVGGEDAMEHEIRIEIFSRHGGRRDVKRVIDALIGALHDRDFALDGARLVNLAFLFGDIFTREPHGFRGLARFRAVTEAA